jgi:phosphohistidine phosphatase
VIFFLRHGVAERGEVDDAARRLTAEGERQSEAAGKALAVLGEEVESCLTSPKVRAADTARLACEALGIEAETAAELCERCDSLELAAGRGDILLVGHEPYLSEEIGRLTGAKVKLRKGGLAIVDNSTLTALLRPDDLASIAAASMAGS